MRILGLRTLVALFICGWSSIAHSQTLALYSLTSKDQKALDRISEKYEIVARKGDRYEIYVPHAKAQDFELENGSATLVQRDADSQWRNNWNKGERFASGYHDYDAVQSFIQNAVKSYPKIASTASYGLSKNGYQLNYLKLSTNSDSQKPKIWLDAATHGDELISTEVLISLVGELLRGYGQDDRLSKMIDKNDIFVSFVVNPDGFVKQQRYEGFFADPNRSYPWPGEPDRKPTPSIQALIDLFEREEFQGAMTFHAYSRLLMYPWGYTRDPIINSDDLDAFSSLAAKLADTNNYTYGSISNTIYVAKGSSADYYYWKHGTRVLAVELSTSKVPNPSKIPEVVNEAREMVWQFIESFYTFE